MQCPNCKFYKVDIDNREVVVSRDVVSTPRIGEAFGGIVVAFIIWLVGGLIFVIIGEVFGAIIGATNTNAVLNIFGAIWTVACLVGCIYFAKQELSAKETRVVTKSDGFSYECRHCGYTWNSKY